MASDSMKVLALLTGIKEYHVYLVSRPFTVYTDHLSLKYLQSLKVSANNPLARWALALQPYKFEINYKEDKKLTATDGISSRPFPEPLLAEDDNDKIAEDSFTRVLNVWIKFFPLLNNYVFLVRCANNW